MNPLELFKTPEVKNLLIDTYSRNFKKAEVNPDYAADFINYIWENKDTKTTAEIYLYIKEIYKKGRRERNVKIITEIPLWDLFDLSQYKNFLDIGCNNMFSINLLAQQYPKMNFTAIDIVDQKRDFYAPERSQFIKIQSNWQDIELKEQSFDVINIKYVLHHFQDKQLIHKVLDICNKALSKNGILIFWEETFDKDFDLEKTKKENTEKNIQTDYDLAQRLYNLSDDQKFEFIIMNDWLINYTNPEMPWNNNYHNWQQWKELLQEHNFTCIKTYNLGIRTNGLLTQGSHMIGIFKK